MTSKKSYVAEQQAVNHTHQLPPFDELVASAIFSNQQRVDEIRAEFGLKKPSRKEREQYTVCDGGRLRKKDYPYLHNTLSPPKMGLYDGSQKEAIKDFNDVNN